LPSYFALGPSINVTRACGRSVSVTAIAHPKSLAPRATIAAYAGDAPSMEVAAGGSTDPNDVTKPPSDCGISAVTPPTPRCKCPQKKSGFAIVISASNPAGAATGDKTTGADSPPELLCEHELHDATPSSDAKNKNVSGLITRAKPSALAPRRSSDCAADAASVFHALVEAHRFAEVAA